MAHCTNIIETARETKEKESVRQQQQAGAISPHKKKRQSKQQNSLQPSPHLMTPWMKVISNWYEGHEAERADSSNLFLFRDVLKC